MSSDWPQARGPRSASDHHQGWEKQGDYQARSQPNKAAHPVSVRERGLSSPLLGRRGLRPYSGGRASRGDSLDAAFASFGYGSRTRSQHRQPSTGDAGDGGDGDPAGGDGGGLPPLAVGINLIKCAVGAGSFSLPQAFASGGVWVTFVLTFVLGALAAYTVSLLATAELQYRAMQPRGAMPLTYPQLAKVAFGRLGTPAMIVCLFGVVVTSLGVCAVYIDFICGAVVDMTRLPAPTVVGPSAATDPCLQPPQQGAARFSIYEVALATSPLVVGLALLRSFKYLVYTSILGDVAVLTGLVGTIVFGVIFMNEDGKQPLNPAQQPFVNDWAKLPQSMGSVAFLFLIHVVILPIAQSLGSPDPVDGDGGSGSGGGGLLPVQQYGDQRGQQQQQQQHAGPDQIARERALATGKRFSKVAWTSYAVIAVMNAFFGAACYCIFGEATAGNVLTNLQEAHHLPWVVDLIQILLCVDLLFTLPMVLAAGREIVERAALDTDFGSRHEALTRNAVRIILVGLVYGVACGIPNFGQLLGLVGAFIVLDIFHRGGCLEFCLPYPPDLGFVISLE